MSLLESLVQLRGMRPFDLRFVLDDQLLRVYNAAARLKERSLPAETKRMLGANRELQGRHLGRRCFIVGNGPSLRDQDLTRLRGEVVFVVNRFIHHPDAEAIDPTYYVIVDPKFATGQWGTDFVEQVERRLPRVEVFLTPDGVSLVRERGLLRHHVVRAVLPNQQLHFGYSEAVDLTRGVPGMDNVTKVALMAAVYMGCTEINLLGVDGNGLILSSGSHFYGHEPPPARQEDLEKALVSMSMGLRSWRAIARYLEQRGVRLVSRNPRSVLTALSQAPFPAENRES